MKIQSGDDRRLKSVILQTGINARPETVIAGAVGKPGVRVLAAEVARIVRHQPASAIIRISLLGLTPVMRLVCEGSVSGQEQEHWAKRTPSRASWSRFGVRAAVSP